MHHRFGDGGLYIGPLWVDSVTFGQALEAIEMLVTSRRGGAVFTPNVDHVVLATQIPALRLAYQDADLAVADGIPLVWLSRLVGRRLPERVAGSDLFLPLMQIAAQRHWRVYLLGGAPGVAARAATILNERHGVHVVGWSSPLIAPDGSDIDGDSISPVREARPDLVIVALGNPKQELWTARARHRIGPAVALGFGAVLDFLAGTQRRAPQWVARAGGEWLYRLAHDPRRLWRRYLVRDLQFLGIAASTWRYSRMNPPTSGGARAARTDWAVQTGVENDLQQHLGGVAPPKHGRSC